MFPQETRYKYAESKNQSALATPSHQPVLKISATPHTPMTSPQSKQIVRADVVVLKKRAGSVLQGPTSTMSLAKKRRAHICKRCNLIFLIATYQL